MANWAKTGSKEIWQNFNLANSNKLACAVHRAVVGSENERWSTCTYVCFVYTALKSSRVSIVAHARRWLPCVRVKWSKQPKRRPEWRMAERHTKCSTTCAVPQLESSYILCKREASNTNDLYAVAVICVGARACMRVHVVYVHTHRLLLARI